MPLLDLVTDLKSLKYGQDRPGGGSSGQPYIQFPVPEQASGDVREYYENNKYSLDFPLRGGGYNIGADGPYVSQAAKYDRLRIKKFMQDSPRGPIFILKQQALQLSNPKIQVGSQINLDLGVLPFKFLGNLENTRIYNGGRNTLQQVGVQGSGLHFDRHGNVPINPYQSTYAYVADDNIAGNADNNRLKLLYETKILNSGKIPLSLEASDQITKLNALGISRDSGLLLQYPGGPNSAGGFGFTTVHRRYITQLYTQNPKTQADYFIQKGNNYVPSYNAKHTVNNNFANPLSYFGKLRGLPDLAASIASAVTGLSIKAAPDNSLRDKSNTTTDKQGAEIGTNRLQYLYEKLLAEDQGTPNPTVLYSYDGGPGGTETTLNRYDYTDFATDATKQTQNASDPNKQVGGIPQPRNFNYTYNYRQLSQQSLNEVAFIGKDFRETVNEEAPTDKNKIASTEGYALDNNIAKKYKVGSPGSTNLQRIDYSKSLQKNSTTVTTDETQDLINMQDLVDTKPEGVKDIIDFHFETIEYGRNPTFIILRAFLTGLQDNHAAEYNPFKYVGRGENFYVYNGFTRQISFNFSVAAQSRSEMKPLYRKVNYLISQLYPDYKSGTGFMRAPLLKLTIGDYIHSQPGFLTSMNVSLNENATWEIAAEPDGRDSDTYQLPQSMDINCQFTPIHDFLPRRSVPTENGYYITPLIARNDVGKNKFDIGNINYLLTNKNTIK